MVLASKAGGKDPKPPDEGHRCDYRQEFEWCCTFIHVDSTRWTKQFVCTLDLSHAPILQNNIILFDFIPRNYVKLYAL